MRQSGETLVRSLSVAAGCMLACRPLHAIHLRALHHKYVLVRSTHWGGFVLAGYTHWGWDWITFNAVSHGRRIPGAVDH